MQMKANYYTTMTTDLVRTIANPLVNEIDCGIFTDLDDFVFDCFIRFIGIKANYPTAKFIVSDNKDKVMIFVDNAMVYCRVILEIGEEVEVEE